MLQDCRKCDRCIALGGEGTCGSQCCPYNLAVVVDCVLGERGTDCSWHSHPPDDPADSCYLSGLRRYDAVEPAAYGKVNRPSDCEAGISRLTDSISAVNSPMTGLRPACLDTGQQHDPVPARQGQEASAPQLVDLHACRGRHLLDLDSLVDDLMVVREVHPAFCRHLLTTTHIGAGKNAWDGQLLLGAVKHCPDVSTATRGTAKGQALQSAVSEGHRHRCETCCSMHTLSGPCAPCALHLPPQALPAPAMRC